MKRRYNFPFFIFFFLFSVVADASALDISPVLNARLLGGQYTFEGEESNLSGNFFLQAAPAVKLNEKWSLIPVLSTSWRGTKYVQELVGGGTLFQQTQDHSINLKGIYNILESWQLKSGGGYRIQLLKETSDERWGKGLFDFQKPSANFEIERAFKKDHSLRFGYDFYYIDFMNFSSLESQQRDLGRENLAEKTLNTTNHGLYFTSNFTFPFFFGRDGKGETSYFYTFRNFVEQNIVLISGDLSGTLRRDRSQMASLSCSLPVPLRENFNLIADFKGTFTNLDSDQNNYDAKKTRFNSNFYSYRDFSTGANLNFLFGQKPFVFGSGFTYARRNYLDRPMQDVSGNYGSDKIHINEYYANFSFTVPMDKNFKIVAISNFGWSRSNMKYEKTYRYNYHTFSYLLGVSYEY